MNKTQQQLAVGFDQLHEGMRTIRLALEDQLLYRRFLHSIETPIFRAMRALRNMFGVPYHLDGDESE